MSLLSRITRLGKGSNHQEITFYNNQVNFINIKVKCGDQTLTKFLRKVSFLSNKMIKITIRINQNFLIKQSKKVSEHKNMTIYSTLTHGAIK